MTYSPVELLGPPHGRTTSFPYGRTTSFPYGRPTSFPYGRPTPPHGHPTPLPYAREEARRQWPESRAGAVGGGGGRAFRGVTELRSGGGPGGLPGKWPGA